MVSHYLISWIQITGGLLVVFGGLYGAGGLLEDWTVFLRNALIFAGSVVFVAAAYLGGYLCEALAGIHTRPLTANDLNNALGLLLNAELVGYASFYLKSADRYLRFVQRYISLVAALFVAGIVLICGHYPVLVALLDGLMLGSSLWLLTLAFRRAPRMTKNQLFSTGIFIGVIGGALLLIPPLLDVLNVRSF